MDHSVKALCFDVGGTMLDWRTGLVGELEKWAAPRGASAPWGEFANYWRALGLRSILDKRKEELPGGNFEGVHRALLPQVFRHFGLPVPEDRELDNVTLFWHQLPAWPDAAGNLARLQQRYVVSTLTILNVALVVSCSKRNGIAWDALISCEMMEAYKFFPEVYTNCCAVLGLEPGEVMMVAAHDLDLIAAGNAGMRTGFVARPEEWGEKPSAGRPDHSGEEEMFDLNAAGMADLADQLLAGPEPPK